MNNITAWNRRWKSWTTAGVLGLAWWFYAAPGYVVKRIRSAATEANAAAIIAARVDFAHINANLSEELRIATRGRLNEASFAHLLAHGWLPSQKKTPAARPADHRQEINQIPTDASMRAQQTLLTQFRYKGLNRFIAIFWDVNQVYEIVLTLERDSVLDRWRVTRVKQINTCAGGYDCPEVPFVDLPVRAARTEHTSAR